VENKETGELQQVQGNRQLILHQELKIVQKHVEMIHHVYYGKLVVVGVENLLLIN
jgi:hypothetical protein